jgi:hypothetical protein
MSTYRERNGLILLLSLFQRSPLASVKAGHLEVKGKLWDSLVTRTAGRGKALKRSRYVTNLSCRLNAYLISVRSYT